MARPGQLEKMDQGRVSGYTIAMPTTVRHCVSARQRSILKLKRNCSSSFFNIVLKRVLENILVFILCRRQTIPLFRLDRRRLARRCGTQLLFGSTKSIVSLPYNSLVKSTQLHESFTYKGEADGKGACNLNQLYRHGVEGDPVPVKIVL